MKLSNHEIEESLKRAIEDETPNVLPQILRRIEENNEPYYEVTETPRKHLNISKFRWAGSFAAMLVIMISVYFGHGYYSIESIISFDVNPSIELRINHSDKVIKAIPLNEDAKTILGDMNLKNTELDVAVNAIIGSMVVNGYINELKNTILISVDSVNAEKGLELQKRLMNDVDSYLSVLSVDGAILGQVINDNEELKAQAEKYNMTMGKASLIDSLIQQDSTLTFEDLSDLPINDINLLISSRKTNLGEVDTKGKSNNSAYISEEEAKEVAYNHAGVSSNDVTSLEIKLDYDEGLMLYKIEFNVNDSEYDYEINAVNGSIVEYKHDIKNPPIINSQTTSTNELISSERALEIALENAGLSRDSVNIVKNISYNKQNILYHDIIFLSDTTKYWYLINASNGEISGHNRNNIDNYGSNTENSYGENVNNIIEATPAPVEAPTVETPQQSRYISSDNAISIAFNHSGANSSEVKKLECKLKDNDAIYKIEFIYGIMEYEYEISAISGEILYWESEED